MIKYTTSHRMKCAKLNACGAGACLSGHTPPKTGARCTGNAGSTTVVLSVQGHVCRGAGMWLGCSLPYTRCVPGPRLIRGPKHLLVGYAI